MSDDEDDDDDAPASSKKPDKPKRGEGKKQPKDKQRGGTTGKKSGDGGRDAAVAGTVAVVGAVTGGESFGMDLKQGASPFLARRFAEFLGGLVPDEGIRWIREEIGTGKNARDVVGSFVLAIIDQLDLMPEEKNKSFNDFVADLVGVVGRRVDGEVFDEAKKQARTEVRTELGKLNKRCRVWLPADVLTSPDPTMHSYDCASLPLSLAERRKHYHEVGIVRARLLIKGAEKRVEHRSCCAAVLEQDLEEVQKLEKKLMDTPKAAEGPEKKPALELLATEQGGKVIEFVMRAYPTAAETPQDGRSREQVMDFLHAHLDFEYELQALHVALTNADGIAAARGLDPNAHLAEARSLFEVALTGIVNAKTATEEAVDMGKVALAALKERADLGSQLGTAKTKIAEVGSAATAGVGKLIDAVTVDDPVDPPSWFERFLVFCRLMKPRRAAPTQQPNNTGGAQPQGGTP
jgi:hypothetical protein